MQRKVSFGRTRTFREKKSRLFQRYFWCLHSHGSHRPWKVLEKSLNWKIVGYSWKFLEVSTEVLEYFWKLLEWKEPSFKKGRSDVLCKGMIESTTTHKFFLVIMKVFSYDFGVPGIVHFPLFEVPLEPYLNEKRYCNKQIPLQLCILKVFTSCFMLL